EFARRTRLGRSTYFNIKKALKADGQLQAVEVPHFTLTAEPPGAVDLEEEVKSVLKQEQRRIDQANLKQQEEQEYRDLDDRFFGDTEEDDDD
ncbi:MAG: hypothetical protein LLF97_01010, partial [Planctomycetaceae bacterium]|nr:hypothetical protein [Planctomycetaceae bacterium]